MAGEIKLLVVLCLVCSSTMVEQVNSSSTEEPGKSTSTSGPASTSTASGPVSPTTASGPASPSTAAGSVSPTTASGPASPSTAAGSVSPTTASGPASPSTAAGPVSPTTAAGPVSPTTAAGPVSPTTAAGPVSPTTAAGPVSPTTAAGPVSPTTAAGPVSPTTAAGPVTSNTTADPVTSNTTADPVTSNTTTAVPNPCLSQPCGQGSTCQPLASQNFTCLCLLGDHYNPDNERCEKAKVFPGQLTLNRTFQEEMGNKTSQLFLSTSTEIAAELKNIYDDTPGFSDATVRELRPAESTRLWSRNAPGVLADIDIIFGAEADIDTKRVNDALHNAIKESSDDSLLSGATFKDGDLCATAPCDSMTTECNSGDGSYLCKCKEGYNPSEYTDHECKACPSGQQAVKNGCEDCPFGRSGFNCSESWKLILVIVGSVLGPLSLISVIVAAVLGSRSSKKNSKRKTDVDVGSPYANKFSTKRPLVSDSSANSRAASVNGSAKTFASNGVPRIPRATTSSSVDRRNNLEMTPSNSRQNLVSAGRNPRLYEDADAANPYTQSRPQANPYAQSRPQNNPYSSNQGYTNPYYKHDNGRSLY